MLIAIYFNKILMLTRLENFWKFRLIFKIVNSLRYIDSCSRMFFDYYRYEKDVSPSLLLSLYIFRSLVLDA